MRNSFIAIALLLAALAPARASAAVVINEIAWMGTDDGGASCEWIELANTDSTDQSLVGWTIEIKNAGSSATPKIIDIGDTSARYTGIAGNGLYLLARNSGACVGIAPEKTADWSGSFGTGISNDGALLTLRNGSSTMNVVDATSGWIASGIGGKNTSGQPKQTPQRVGTGWTTAVPTPRLPNLAPEPPDIDEDPSEDPQATTTPTIGGSSVDVAPAPYLLPKMYIVAGGNRLVATGADATYRAAAYDERGKYRPGAEITWAFGDGDRKKGSRVAHAYHESGQYLAVVRATYGSATAVRTIVIDAVDTDVTITAADERGIELTNAEDRMIDLSGWIIASGEREFVIPDDTVLMARASAIFSREHTRIETDNEVTLLHPNGRSIATYARPVMNTTTAVEDENVDTLSVRTFVVPAPVRDVPTLPLTRLSVPATAFTLAWPGVARAGF